MIQSQALARLLKIEGTESDRTLDDLRSGIVAPEEGALLTLPNEWATRRKSRRFLSRVALASLSSCSFSSEITGMCAALGIAKK
jgi:hypothetical protein